MREIETSAPKQKREIDIRRINRRLIYDLEDTATQRSSCRNLVMSRLLMAVESSRKYRRTNHLKERTNDSLRQNKQNERLEESVSTQSSSYVYVCGARCRLCCLLPHEKNKEDTRTKGRKETETSRPRILAIRMQETIEKKFDLRMYQLIAYLHLNKDKDWPMI